jgi:hypothetical protein
LAAQEQVAVIENAVNNLMEVDPKGDIFRYTESIMDDQHLKDWSDINLEVIELHPTFRTFILHDLKRRERELRYLPGP